MKAKQPKNYCQRCNDPIYDNVNSDCKITCGRCVQGIPKKRLYGGEDPTLGAEVWMITEIYQGISKGEQGVRAVEYLEKITGENFKDTKDFKRKMKRFLDGGYFRPSHLKQYREDRGWSQKVMAMHLEMPQQKVSDMEKGRKPLNQKVIGRLKRCDLWHYKWENLDKYKQTYVPPKKGCKNGLQTKELGGRKSAKKGNPLLFLDPMDSKGKCVRCGGYFHDFEMTIDDSFVARPICENCTDEKNHN